MHQALGAEICYKAGGLRCGVGMESKMLLMQDIAGMSSCTSVAYWHVVVDECWQLSWRVVKQRAWWILWDVHDRCLGKDTSKEKLQALCGAEKPLYEITDVVLLSKGYAH